MKAGGAIQDPGRIRAPATVQEGGTVTIDVGTGAPHVFIAIPGVGRTKVRVHAGVAEYRLPPGVTGGTVIFISDCQLPNPAGTSTLVVGNQ